MPTYPNSVLEWLKQRRDELFFLTVFRWLYVGLKREDLRESELWNWVHNVKA